MRMCAICNKKPVVGNSIARRGLTKKSGGIGLKTTGITRRRFYLNIQNVKIRFPNGTVKKVNVCVKCIKAGKVTKAVSQKYLAKKAKTEKSAGK